MDTFLIFAFVFGISGWGIWRLLIYTRDTIGTNSPLKVVRVYQIAEWQYFLKIENLATYYLLGISLLLLQSAFSAVISEMSIALGHLIMFCFGIIPFALCVFYMILDINHWKSIRNVILETNPAEHALTLYFPDHSITIRDGDLEKVIVTSNEAKARFCYITYFLKNGQKFILSDKMPGIEVILEYFKKIPIEHRKEAFPYIK